LRCRISKMVVSTLPTVLISRHQEQVHAIEQTKATRPSTVKTILVCHSMGGILAADSLLSMIEDNDPLYPSILGILAYDTPYLGLNPPVIHRTISTRVNSISTAVSTAREWIPQSLFASKSTQVTLANQTPTASRWGLATKMAAVGAGVAAVGALSYFAKDPIVNHLQFVKVLYKPDELARRMKRLHEVQNIGFAVFYTVVTTPSEDDKERTFCILPEVKEDGKWIRQENGLAKDEVDAHCGMFLAACNDHYDEMCRQSVQMIRDWIGRGY
jgi:hypothetical protein